MLLLCFIAVDIAFLGILFIILHRSLGAIPRLEDALDRVINGESSLRITIRKKDIIQPLADKVNKVLDLLESKSTGN